MTTQFPGNIDTLTNPNASDKLNNPSHSSQHTNINDAMEAVQAYVGVASSTSNATLTGKIKALEAGGAGLTDVNVTAPLTKGGTASVPIIGMPVATTTVNGYLSSANWNTFNNKQPLLVNQTNIKSINGVSILGAGDMIITSGVSSVLVTAPVTNSGSGAVPNIGMPVASAIVNGYLSSANWNTFNNKQPAGNYVTTDTAQTITGDKVFTKPLDIRDATSGVTGSISMVPDPNSSIGDTLMVESPQGVTLQAPYIVLDTSNLQLAYSGATTGEQLIIAGVDSFGIATIGLQAPLPAAYSVQDTHDANVIIKAANTTPPTAWVALGLSVTLPADAPTGTATLQFTVTLSNPTIRTGVVEWGMTVNGGAPLYRDIVTQIPTNFLQDVSVSVPLANSYNTGDVIALVARVTTNDNNQFSLTAIATPSEVNIMRFSVVGATGTLPAPSNMVTLDTVQTITGQKTFTQKILGTASNADAVDGWSVEVVSALPTTQDPNTIYFVEGAPTDNIVTTDTTQTITGQKTFTQTILGTVTDAEEVPWTGVQNKPTEFPPSAHGHVISDVANLQTALNGKLGVNDNAVSATTATVASAVDDLNSTNVVKQWIGTEAQYTALGTYDPYTYYAITDGQTPGGGGGTGTSVAWDDVTGKPTTFPPSAHNQAISTITGLQTALDGKLATTAAAASVVDQGAGASLKLWYGTEAQYTALGIKDATTLYFRSA